MSGWHPDPTGRFEYRYHNDRQWTSDVSTGGQRFVDPLPPTGPYGSYSGPYAGPAPRSRSARNGMAIAGMVCGIVSVVVGWVPFVAFGALVVAGVGLVLSIVGFRRSRANGAGRGFAIAGLVTSAAGIVTAVVGIVFSVALARAIDRYQTPGPTETTIATCVQDDGDVVATGTITNLSSEERTYTVVVRLAPGYRDSVAVEDVAAGATAEFTATDAVPSFVFEEGGCRVVGVDGPIPFGLDPDIFE
ncbi:MAG: DUF4190 domain-containing protein [Ilumatobacteraceae bacterium]